MKNDNMKQSLACELANVRVSRDLKRRILAEAAASRAPSKKQGFSIRPLAVAAAVMVTIGLSAGVIALRSEKPDLSTTPLSSNNVSESVWAGDDGLYHGNSSCGDQTDMRRMTPSDARAEGLKACSKCFEPEDKAVENLVWMMKDGAVYHKLPDCSGMDDAVGVMEIEAKTLGREKCGICLDGDIIESWPKMTEPMSTSAPVPLPTKVPGGFQTLPYSQQNQADVVYAYGTPEPTVPPVMTSTPMPTETPTTPMPTPAAPAADAQTVWVWQSGGIYYHADEYCASHQTVAAAKNMGKLPCAVCDAVGLDDVDEVFFDFSDSYHSIKDCTAREKPQQREISEAKESGFAVCPLCMRGEYEEETALYANVWLTDDGVFFHRARNCMGTSGAYERTRTDAVLMGKRACQVCMDEEPVWINDDNPYYHLFEKCGYGQNYKEIDEATAISQNKRPCPMCLPGKAGSPIAEKFILAAEAEGLEVLVGKDATYHVDELCSGLETDGDGYAIAKETGALKWGKVPCDKCLSVRYETLDAADYAEIGKCLRDDTGELWMAEDGDYYHTNMKCSGMKDALPCDVAEALRDGKLPCPTCAKQFDEVWVTENGHVYHLSSDCMGIVGAEKMTGSEAAQLNLKICEKCHAELIESVGEAE